MPASNPWRGLLLAVLAPLALAGCGGAGGGAAPGAAVAPGADAALSSLAVSAGTLTPAFAPATLAYASTVPATVTSVTVTATARDPHAASLSVNGAPVASGHASGAVALAPDAVTTVSVVVTAEDGVHTRAYHLHVTRPGPAVDPESSVTTQWGRVDEPGPPATVCTTLVAALSPVNGSVDPLDAVSAQSNPDGARIQAAIGACPAGQAVKLVAGAPGASAFLSGPLTLRSGVTLWIDAGVTLFASRSPADYYKPGTSTCGTATASSTKTCNPLILASATTDSGIVGDGAIDGRGGSVLTSGPNAGYRTWWDVAWQNKSEGLNQQNPRLIQVNGGARFTLHRVTIQNSPNFHVVTDGVAGVTVWGVKILTPSLAYSTAGYDCSGGVTPPALTPPSTCFTPDTAKNTDGFDPGQSTSVLMAHSHVSVGDDNVAIKASSGASRGLAFLHDHFYYGHGLSIGSETNGGVSDVLVEDLSIDGQDSPNGNGLRIKSDMSKGGVVDGVTYRRVCVRNERRPLVFDAYYSGATGALYPTYRNVVVQQLRNLGSAAYGGGVLTFAGFSASYPIDLALDGVVFDGAQPSFSGAHNGGPASPAATHFTLGPGPVSFSSSIVPSGPADVTVTGVPGAAPPLDCSGAFPALSAVLPGSPL